MKKIYLICILLFTLQKSNAQNLFYFSKAVKEMDKSVLELLSNAKNDTVSIGKDAAQADVMFEITNEEKNALKNMLAFINNPKTYLKSSKPKLDIQIINNVISRYNQKLKDVTIAFPSSAYQFTAVPLLGLAAALPNLISGVSGFSGQQETDFYNAIGKYVTKEFKKSVTATYMQVFTDVLDKYGELNVFFPATYEHLKNKDPFTYPDFGKDEKDVYNKDLRNLLANFSTLLEQESGYFTPGKFKYLDYAKVQKITSGKYYPYFKVSLDIGDKLLNKYHPIEILNYLDQKYYNAKSFFNANTNFDQLGAFFHGANILQSAFRDTATEKTTEYANTWVSFEALKSMATDPKRLEFFIYLVALEDEAFFAPMITKYESISANFSYEDFWRTYISPTYEILVKIQEFKKDTKVEDKEYTHYMQFTLDLITRINKDYLTTPIFTTDQLFIAQKTLDILKSVHEKDYNNLTLHFSLLAEKLVEEQPNTAEYTKFLALADKFNKYSKFMVSMVNTTSPQEMEQVINQLVAPANSYLKKRKSGITVGLNAYPGFFAGSENLKTDNAAVKAEKSGFNFGITAPIGLDLTFGLHKKNKTSFSAINEDGSRKYTGRSFSIFFQVIDIGSIVNYRLKDDTTSTLPQNISFGQLFSPGVSLNFAPFKNNALNFGIGYQWTPQLRTITKDGNEYAANSNRWFIRAAWDLPLFNIFKHPKY